MADVRFFDIRCVITLTHEDVEAFATGTAFADLVGIGGTPGTIIALCAILVAPVLQAECALAGHRGVHITIILPTGTVIPTPNFPPPSSEPPPREHNPRG